MSAKETKENIVAFGHENIQTIHPSTLMFTKQKHLSKTGDCVVGVASDKAVANLSQIFKDALRKPNVKLTVIIEAGGITEQINAFGSPKLILTHLTDMVIRKSDYICNRTLAIRADKSANDLPRELVEKLKNPNQKVNITLVLRG
ncbi:MAG TPA: DUF371 domain-containing protein [Verrucomicrobiae bacterium]|nr:DUF371 domain-containing protein [Verrucomicrobiae bacterium]